MKRINRFRAGRVLPVLLCLLLAIGLAGCEETPSSPDSSVNLLGVSSQAEVSGAKYPMLEDLLLSQSPDHFSIYLGENNSVQITRDLLKNIYEKISAAELTKIENGEFLNYYEPDALQFYYYETVNDYPSNGVSIYPKNNERTEYPDQTVLALPGEGSPGYYVAPWELYSDIRRLVDAHTTPSDVSFEGSYQLLQVPRNEYGEWTDCFFDQDGRIFFVQNWQIVNVLEASTGKLLYTIKSLDQIVRAEPHGDGIRLLTEAAVVDYDKDGNELNRTELPEEIRASLQEAMWLNHTQRYDVAGDKIAYPTADGVYLWENGEARKVLDNAKLPAIVQEKEHYSSDLASRCSYSDPQLLVGGTRLSAVVNLVNSQNGYCGLVIQNLETGEDTYFWNLFGILRSGLNILDDETIQTFSEAGVTRIDAATLERSITDTPRYEGIMSYFESPDGTSSFQTRQYRDEEGVLCLEISLLDDNGDAETLCTIIGEQYYSRSAITSHYLIYYYQDSEKAGIAAIPYR